MRAREIKYRAWVKDGKIMVDWETMLKCENPTQTQQPFINFFTEHLKNVVLMQATGLKDINDKEIYEGDILRTTFIKDMGEKGKGTSVVIWNEFIGAWMISYTGAGGGPASDYLHKYQHEIIGNVPQNPQLLPKQDEEKKHPWF